MRRDKPRPSTCLYRLHFGHDLDARQVTHVLTHFATGMPQAAAIVLEVLGTGRRLEHRLRIPEAHSAQLLQQLRATLPLRVEPCESLAPRASSGVEVRLVGGRGLLRETDPAATSRALLAALRPGTGERLWLQWVVRSGGVGRGEPSWTALIDQHLARLAGRSPAVDPKALLAKQQQPQLVCSLRLSATARSPQRAAQLLRGVTATLGQVRGLTTYLTPMPIGAAAVERRITQPQVPTRTSDFRLTPSELTPLLAWPIGDPVIPGLSLGASRHWPPSGSLSSDGIVIGSSTLPGDERPVALSIAQLSQHVAVTSPTRTGKSTLLANIALQAIAAGVGTVVVDWKGDTVTDILDRLPAEQANPVIVFDPLAPDAVVGLPNPFTASAERDRRVDQLSSMLMRSWDFASAPRSAALTQTSLFTLARAGGCAVVDLPELLTNPRFRRNVLGRLTDQTGLAAFWRQFEQMSEPERAQVVAPTLNRTRSWLLHRDVRHAFGQAESTWHMDAVLDGGVLLVSLARGALGDDLAALLGSLLVGDLLSAVRRRSRRAQSQRLPALVVLDEFQHLHALAEGFADDLVTAGGMGVGFVMAHQHLAQLTPSVKEAVLANARSRLVFQLSSSDAATQARELGVNAADLQHLPAFHAIARLATAHGVSDPVSLTTAPLPPSLGNAQLVRAASQAHYAVSRKLIDEQLRRRYEPPSEATPAIGARKRG